MKSETVPISSLAMAAFMLLAIMTAACSMQSPPAVDIDGHSYRSVKIGAAVWTAENLDVARFRNGDAIPHVEDPAAWAALQSPAWCWNGNDPENGKHYGRLYNWYAVHDPRGLAPEGWHVATDEEWSRLAEKLGGAGQAGGRMKSTEGWQEPNDGAEDAVGFTLLPAGARRDTDGEFMPPGAYARMWSSTQAGRQAAWSRSFGYYDGAVRRGKANMKTGFAVRCVKD